MPAQACYTGGVNSTVPSHVLPCPNKEEGTLYKNLTLMFKPKKAKTMPIQGKCWTSVRLNKCCLADDTSGFFFFVSVLAVCKPTRYILPPTVMICVHKNAKVRNHVTNVKTDQQGRAERGAMVPRHSIENSLVLENIKCC